MKAIPSKSTGVDSAQSGLHAPSGVKDTLVANGLSPQLDCELLEGRILSSIAKKNGAYYHNSYLTQSFNSHKCVFMHMVTLLNSSLVGELQRSV